MKRLGVFALTLAATFVAAGTADDQAYLAILAETHVMQMAGMPKMDMPQLPPGIKMPAGFQMPGRPSRTLNVRLWSPTIAPANATAVISPPAGLKQGDKLDLALYRPKPDAVDDETAPGQGPDKVPDFKILIYWGSSETVQPGQPKVISFANLGPEEKAEMRRRSSQARQSAGSYFYKPNWTTGYWPTDKQKGNIGEDASLVGTYNLTTNYTGNVSVDAPSNVEFLPPIEFSSPDLTRKVNLTSFVPFQWAALPNALGQYASAFGMQGKNTLIIWSSSDVYQEGLMANMDFMQMAEVRQRVADHIFMAPDVTKMTIPSGIFKDADMAMLNMVAYGPGSAREGTNPLPRIQTKSTLMLMMGGKMARDMGGMGDDGD